MKHIQQVNSIKTTSNASTLKIVFSLHSSEDDDDFVSLGACVFWKKKKQKNCVNKIDVKRHILCIDVINLVHQISIPSGQIWSDSFLLFFHLIQNALFIIMYYTINAHECPFISIYFLFSVCWLAGGHLNELPFYCTAYLRKREKSIFECSTELSARSFGSMSWSQLLRMSAFWMANTQCRFPESENNIIFHTYLSMDLRFHQRASSIFHFVRSKRIFSRWFVKQSDETWIRAKTTKKKTKSTCFTFEYSVYVYNLNQNVCVWMKDKKKDEKWKSLFQIRWPSV